MIEMADIVITIVIAAVSGMAYAITGYVNNAGDKLDAVKVGVNAVAGAIIGGFFATWGDVVSMENVLRYVAMYAGALALVEQTLKGLWKRYKGVKTIRWV